MYLLEKRQLWTCITILYIFFAKFHITAMQIVRALSTWLFYSCLNNTFFLLWCLVKEFSSIFTVLHRCLPLMVIKENTIFFIRLALWTGSCIAISARSSSWLTRISATISFVISRPRLKISWMGFSLRACSKALRKWILFACVIKNTNNCKLLIYWVKEGFLYLQFCRKFHKIN